MAIKETKWLNALSPLKSLKLSVAGTRTCSPRISSTCATSRRPSSKAALAHDAKPRQAARVKYTGERNSKGQRHGQGTMVYANGIQCTGAWKEGKRHGEGTWTHPDGDKYTGETNYKSQRHG